MSSSDFENEIDIFSKWSIKNTLRGFQTISSKNIVEQSKSLLKLCDQNRQILEKELNFKKGSESLIYIIFLSDFIKSFLNPRTSLYVIVKYLNEIFYS